MAIERKYSPIQRVNIGPGKDDVNDFARKYNLEVENLYQILNKYNARKVVFYETSDYWSETETGYKLSLVHNDNIVFAVYRTIDANTSTQVLVGVSLTKTNVELESVEKFDGYMLYAAVNGDIGIGYNTEDDVVAIMNAIKEETEEIVQNATEVIDSCFSEHGDGAFQFDYNLDLMPCRFPIGNENWEVNTDGSLTTTNVERSVQ